MSVAEYDRAEPRAIDLGPFARPTRKRQRSAEHPNDMLPDLVDEATLEAMAVVANNTMHRERGLDGRDGYRRNLRLDPLQWLSARAPDVDRAAPPSWLDLCCGTARALREAAALTEAAAEQRVRLTGVDLIPVPSNNAGDLRVITASLASWRPSARYDLITCVHGLHYVGDKLGLLARIATWLADGGRFVANFDVSSIHTTDGGRNAVVRSLRSNGFRYDARRRLVTRDGPGSPEFRFRFLGADPHAGPNYTGQPAVAAYYEPIA